MTLSCQYLQAAPTSMPYSTIERDILKVQRTGGPADDGGDAMQSPDDLAQFERSKPSWLFKRSSTWRCQSCNAHGTVM